MPALRTHYGRHNAPARLGTANAAQRGLGRGGSRAQWLLLHQPVPEAETMGRRRDCGRRIECNKADRGASSSASPPTPRRFQLPVNSVVLTDDHDLPTTGRLDRTVVNR